MQPGLAALRSAVSLLGGQVQTAGGPACTALSLQRTLTSGSIPEPAPNADWGVYKGKGCCRFKLISPTWANSISSKGNKTQHVEKEGVMLLEGAAVAAVKVGAGARSYNWGHKFTFGLKAQELGALILQEPGGSCPKLEFYHDPNKGSAHEGAITKTLSVLCNPDGSRLFTVLHKEQAGKLSFAVPMTVGEFHTFKTLATAFIPHLLGFDRVMKYASASE